MSESQMSLGPTTPVKRSDRTLLRDVQNVLHIETNQASQSKSVIPCSIGPNIKDHTAVSRTVGLLDYTVENTDQIQTHSLLDCGVRSSLILEQCTNNGDITFKSFLCPGGEIELSDSTEVCSTQNVTEKSHSPVMCDCSEVAEESLGPLQYGDSHTDHPYCQVARKVQTEELPVSVDEPVSESHVFKTNDGIIDQDGSVSVPDLTLKSFAFAGVEIEIADGSHATSEMSALFKHLTLEDRSQCSEHTEADPEVSECSGQHTEHAYCVPAANISQMMPAVCAETSVIFQENQECSAGACSCLGLANEDENKPRPEDGHVTLKSFICTGGEVEVFEEGSDSLEKSTIIIEEDTPSHSPSFPEDSVSVEDGAEDIQGDRSHNDHAYYDVQRSTSGGATQAPPGLGLQPCEEIPDALLSNIRETDCSTENTSTARPEPLTADPAPSVQLLNSPAAPAESNIAKDSALGLEMEPEVMRCESPMNALSDAIVSPSLKSILVSVPSTPKNSFLYKTMAQDLGVDSQEGKLWDGVLESPIPPPMFNSTALPISLNCTPAPTPQSKAMTAPPPPPPPPPPQVGDPPPSQPVALTDGALQVQLKQMAELLLLASGKFAAPAAAVDCHSTAVGTSLVQKHSICVCTSPVRQVERSTNTSVLVEPVKEILASDASTSTDSLLWNLNPGSLESVPRQELEQRLTSYLIMTDALLQQLASARAQTQYAGPLPSDLRDKLIQTDHTEFSQVDTYKDLYVIALEKIQSLQLDLQNLQNLQHSIEAVTATMATIKTEADNALSEIKETGAIVNEDHESISAQTAQMKVLYGKCVDTLTRMQQKTKYCIQERDNMKLQMEEAIQAKEAALSVTEQLRAHSAARLAELEENVGSSEELLQVLKHTFIQQVSLNKDYVESLNAADELLKGNLQDHIFFLEELRKSQQLLQRTRPVLLELHQKAANAVEQSQQNIAEKDQVLEEKAQIQNELDQACTNLQEASEQIRDLNMQITILNSEMTVLRQQLAEVEEERSELEMRSTELSATVTSTLASYAFLENALASETQKLQQCMQDSKEARQKALGLEEALKFTQSEAAELRKALAAKEDMLSELHRQAKAHAAQRQQLHELREEMSSAREMKEYLQMENDMMREQVVEGEGMLRSHLQGLREKNLECEDLKVTLAQLRLERESLEEELARTQAMLLEQEDQQAQATNDVTLLHHQVHCLNSSLQQALAETKSVPSEDDATSQQPQRPASFVDSVIMAITAESQDTECGLVTDAGIIEDPEEVEEEIQKLGFGRSAFTRVAPVTPKRQEEEPPKTVVELLGDLSQKFSELTNTIEQLQQSKEGQQKVLQQHASSLQDELYSSAHSHQQEVLELKYRVEKLQAQIEKDAVALQQKAQDEKAMKKLCSEMDENMESLQRLRAESTELRRELSELHLSRQQSQMETHALREELNKACGQSASSMKAVDERIHLLKEMDKLKQSLEEVKESRAKLLERAKRHQMVHVMNQGKLERELHLLDDMIETVRKTLSSVPQVVKNCPQLQQLTEYLG
ncbi:sperm-associated antigen 5 [Denticeps clupeoides]|uniref:sperm-associated antigen 5 n=1 Tax=Denticeps clupeoides TaxID=299321 RepID=UPI0010A3129D|nr:sperm-associated antigen 5 [Denticeps clupeoides]